MTNALIVDANCFISHFRKEVEDAVRKKKLKILLSENSKLKKELKGANEKESGKFKEYSKMDAFHFVCEKSVNKKHEQLEKCSALTSDDPHVIALAIVSGANILHTEDSKLKDDFKNCKEIDRQSGCIERQNHPSSRKVIKANSPNSREVERILKTASAKCEKCKCMINGGGCQ
jgi:predicted nucleic acid-binding protein